MIKLFLASIFVFFLAGCGGGGSETAVPVGLELNASQLTASHPADSQTASSQLIAAQQANQPIYIAGKLWPRDQPIPIYNPNQLPTDADIAMAREQYRLFSEAQARGATPEEALAAFNAPVPSASKVQP